MIPQITSETCPQPPSLFTLHALCWLLPPTLTPLGKFKLSEGQQSVMTTATDPNRFTKATMSGESILHPTNLGLSFQATMITRRKKMVTQIRKNILLIFMTPRQQETGQVVAQRKFQVWKLFCPLSTTPRLPPLWRANHPVTLANSFPDPSPGRDQIDQRPSIYHYCLIYLHLTCLIIISFSRRDL